MRSQRFMLVLALVMFSSASLLAQSERKPEIFLGYSNLQAQGLPDKNNLTGIFGSDFFNNRTTLHGFDAEFTAFPADIFGITGNFSFNENNRSNSSTTTDFAGIVTGSRTDSVRT